MLVHGGIAILPYLTKADVVQELLEGSFVRVIHVEAVCGESAVSDLGLIGVLNDWFGDMRGTAAVAAPHLRTDAASAKVENRMTAKSRDSLVRTGSCERQMCRLGGGSDKLSVPVI